MPSRADTLKVAQADLSEIKSLLSDATASLQGRGLYSNRPGGCIQRAIPILEKVTRHLRQTFNVAKEEINA